MLPTRSEWRTALLKVCYTTAALSITLLSCYLYDWATIHAPV